MKNSLLFLNCMLIELTLSGNGLYFTNEIDLFNKSAGIYYEFPFSKNVNISSDFIVNKNIYSGNQAYNKTSWPLVNTGSSGNPEKTIRPVTYIGLGALLGELILLSNDIYFYPSYSFIKGFFEGQDYVKGVGWVFGCRKTFKHSAIEYGISVTTFSERYYMTDGTTTFSKIYLDKKTGFHVNYVHQFLYNKTPSWQKLYAGPTLNLVEKFGFGGIAGTEFRLSDRFRFDIRYEYTTQTNQVQAGLIFNFQKKYFWKKH